MQALTENTTGPGLTWRLLVVLLLVATIPARAEEPDTPQTSETAPTNQAETISLESAIQRALASNYTIKVRSYAVPIAEQGVVEARARFDPQVFLNYTDSTQNNPSGFDAQGRQLDPSVLDNSGVTGGISGELPLGLSYEIGGSVYNPRGDFPEPEDPTQPSGDYDIFQSSVGATVRLPILRGFGTSATLTSIRIARTDLNISEWDFRSTVINTVTNVVYAFDELMFARANLRSARRARELANQTFRENERRQQVGQMSEYDVLSARARVATREEGILQAERFVREAENQLKQLISGDTSAGLLRTSLELVAPPEPTEMIVDVESDLPRALELRPDYQQAKLALARNDYSFRFYRNQLLPSVTLVGSYNYNGTGPDFASSRRLIQDRTYPEYSTGITVSFPLTSSAERARYRSARLARSQAEMTLRQLEQDIVVRVGNAAGQIETAWHRVLASQASRQLSQQTLDAEEKKLRAGTGNTFFVLQQQEIVSNDEVREARAIADYRNALAEYDRQLGRTLDTYRIDLAQAGELENDTVKQTQ